jgi:ATP-dependent Lon protease
MANGLAVTMFGGDLLPAEATISAGKGKVTLTGKLGEVMQESAQAALTYVRARSLAFGLEPDFHEHGLPHPLPRGGGAEGRAERRA